MLELLPAPRVPRQALFAVPDPASPAMPAYGSNGLRHLTPDSPQCSRNHARSVPAGP
ncbi:MAG: hypothetical protein ACRDRX_18075 [Pseudonocardiaceae bacterium]